LPASSLASANIVTEFTELKPDFLAQNQCLKRWDVVEARLSYPHTRRYRCFAGASDMNTRMRKREWSSLAAFEVTLEKSLTDLEGQGPYAEFGSVALSNQFEFYLLQ
jgi:hypothetical protein